MQETLTIGNYEQEMIKKLSRERRDRYIKLRNTYDEGGIQECSDCGTIGIDGYAYCLECNSILQKATPLPFPLFCKAEQMVERIAKSYPGYIKDPVLQGIFCTTGEVRDWKKWALKIGETFR